MNYSSFELCDLPPEIIQEILFNLSIDDLLVCRTVSKLFKDNVDHLRIDELLVSNLSARDLPITLKWPGSNAEVNCHRCFSSSFFLHYKSWPVLLQSILSKLKKLFIGNSLDFDSNRFFEIPSDVLYDTFRSFKQLEVLQLNLSDIHSANVQTLSLPNLKILSIFIYKFKPPLIFDTPKLERLKFSSQLSENKFKFVHTAKVTWLECGSYEYFASIFPNLVHLKCKHICDGELTGQLKEMLFKLPNLKQIHLDGPRSAFYELRRLKRELNVNLKIYYQEIEFDDEIPANHTGGHIIQSNVMNYVENYSKVADELEHKWIKYNFLEQHFGNLPAGLAGKFIYLSEFYIDGAIRNQNQLEVFLNELTSFDVLKIRSSKLAQNFYTNLPVYCPLVKVLFIYEEDENYKLNFEFVLKMSNLQRFRTNQAIPADLCNQIKVKFDYDPYRLKFIFDTTLADDDFCPLDYINGVYLNNR